ncbi:MAG: hypothetical protein HY259_08705 [Chloroflexi bacterium]|nr:hypothetical protein [Chloroflexota bacterium]
MTRETLWTDGQGPPITDGQGMANGSLSSATGYSPDGELRLRDVVRFLLVPARCGVFLSRARLGQMAKTIGTRLPFGSRFEVAEWLFTSAGESGRVGLLLSELQSEVDEWLATYSAWAEAYPVWQSAAAPWLARAQAAHEMLQAMAVIALTPAPIEIGSAEEP